jgi:hypothetical protein
MASNEIDLSEFVEQPKAPSKEGPVQRFLRGGAFGLGTIPADIANLIALPGTVTNLGQNLASDEEVTIDEFSGGLNDWADRSRNWVGDLVGVKPDDFGTPDNAAGDVGYVASQFLLPAGMIGKAVSKAPKAIKVGAEVLDQFVSRGTNKYLTGAGVGLVGGAALYANPEEGEQDLREFIPTDEPQVVSEETEVDLSEFSDPGMDLSEFQQPVVKHKEGSIIRDTIKYGAPALAGLAAAVILHRSITKAGVRNRLNTVSEKFGINDVETVVPKSTVIKQGWLDRNASAKEIYADVNPDKAKDFEALVDVGQATGSVETMFSDVARTGRIIGSDVRLPRMTDIYSKVGSMTPDQQKLLMDAMDAGDRLSNIRYRGMADGNPLQHQLLLDAAKKDQNVAGVMADMKSFYNGMAKFMHDEGLIDRDMMNLWRNDDFVYLPEYTAQTPLKVGEKIVDFLSGQSRDLKPSTGTTSLFKRTEPLPENVKRMNPLDSMEQYTLSILDFAHANKIRRQFADSVIAYGSADNKYRKLLRVVDAGDKPDMRVYRNGKSTYYKVSDETLRNTLQFAPQRLGVILSSLNKMRQVKQQFTTGRYRPTQAIRSAIYDVWTGANVSPSMLGNYARGKKGDFSFGLFPGDVLTTIPNIMGRGLWENAKARIADNASRLLVDSVNRSGVLAGIVGPTRSLAVANKLADYYSDSVLSMFRRVGASSLGNLHDISTARGLKSMMSQIDNHLKGHPNASRLGHFYDGLLESVHNSVRLGYFAKNYGKLASKEPDLERLYQLSKSTRQLTGDPGIQGAGGFAQSLSATVPYYNIGLQTVRKLVGSFRERPFETSGAIFSSTILPALATSYLMSENDEERDWFWNELSPYERVSNLYIPSGTGGPPLSITLPNEVRPFYAMALAWFDTLFGFSNGNIHSDASRPTRNELESWLGTRATEDLFTAVKTASPLTEQGLWDNPLTAGALMVGDKKMAPDGSIIPLTPKQVAGPGSLDYNIPGDVLNAEMEELLRSVFGVVARDGLNLLNTTLGTYRDSQNEVAAYDAGLDQYSLDVGSRFPVVGHSFFPETKRKSLDTVDSRILYDKLNGIKTIQNTVTENIRQADLLKTGDYAVRADWIGKTMADPRMIPIMMTANEMGSNIMQNQMNQISLMRDEYKATQANYRLSVDERAKLLNKLSLHILTLEKQTNLMIRDTESLLEDQIWTNYGVHKVVRLEDLNKDTTLDALPDR